MINKEPLVSIVITYYKKKKYIAKTLKSIFDQTYKNLEIIFIYDDSDNEDLKFIRKLLSKFKKKKLIINKKNLGVAKSRNLGLRFCSGSYVAFLDSDDLWKKKKLSIQINFMKENFSVFSFTSYNIISENGKYIGKRKVIKDAEYIDMIKSNYIGLSTVVINLKKIKTLKFPNLKTQEDFALWLLLLRKGYKLNYLNQFLTSWRKSNNSLSSNIFQKISDAFKLYYLYENKNFIISIYSVLVLSFNRVIRKL
jgi:glycosyltransferase involved in cell wall biosynthesis